MMEATVGGGLGIGVIIVSAKQFRDIVSGIAGAVFVSNRIVGAWEAVKIGIIFIAQNWLTWVVIFRVVFNERRSWSWHRRTSSSRVWAWWWRCCGEQASGAMEAMAAYAVAGEIFIVVGQIKERKEEGRGCAPVAHDTESMWSSNICRKTEIPSTMAVPFRCLKGKGNKSSSKSVS
jgi:hypothetical protein